MLWKFLIKRAFVVIVLAIAFIGIQWKAWPSFEAIEKYLHPAPSFVSTGPTITALQSMGHLVTLKCSIGDVLEANDGTFRGAWIIKGDALVAVDLRQAQLISSDEQNRTVIIQLPNPRTVSARIDHARTKTYSFQRSSWLFIPGWGDQGPLRDAAMKEAQRLIEAACSREDILAEARTITSLMICSIYRMAGFDVKIQWEDPMQTDMPKQATTSNKPKG